MEFGHTMLACFRGGGEDKVRNRKDGEKKEGDEEVEGVDLRISGPTLERRIMKTYVNKK